MFCIPWIEDDIPWQQDAKDKISPTWYFDVVPSTWYDGVCTSSDIQISVSLIWDDDMTSTLEDGVADDMTPTFEDGVADDMTPTLEDGVASQFNCLLEHNSFIHSLCLSNYSSLFLCSSGSCSSLKVNSSLLLCNFLSFT